ncbi:hypothetical protein BACCIP111899_01597 [Bacillus rhizoplanae]|uniref:Uncharacterized protein n=1 Tax=Bacillus rhizoplanae TaxID=2880966 RepID=A0ABM8Y9V1_9BACI|nr:hypothetical protein [Bacillus rhizoplanae]CAG9612421.1 hypothetical protein BACCIP111899_01597 [Bacillus rhizoplanae]
MAETISIKDFMSGDYGAKKRLKKVKKNIKKYAPVAVRVTIILGSSILFSQIVDIPVFASGGVDAPVFNDVTPDSGLQNYVDGQLYSRVTHAFEPVAYLIKAIAYPIASIVAMGGGLFCIIGNKEKGFSLIQQAGIGYIIVQMIPLLMKLLVEIAKSI